ncbi:MAG: trypsin-like peptidase domain-containing protein [Deltaproteobacteria bacterium]|nr:trypsin-like peptidase domain-containing protein [Deltaproteobacteria bacterium]
MRRYKKKGWGNFNVGPMYRLAVSLAALLVTVLILQSNISQAQIAPTDKLGSLSFSKLIVRVENDYEIAIAPDEYRVFIIEELRKAGFNVKGAESLLFDQDKSNEARFILGATLTELDCGVAGQFARQKVCDMGVEWQLFDRRRDEVIYKVLTRSFMYINRATEAEKAIKHLVLATLKSLINRPKFAEVQKEGTGDGPQTDLTNATFKNCHAAAMTLPGDIADAQAASVVVKVGDGTGSGFFISDDGLIITASHVIGHRQQVDIAFNNGTLATATVVRRNKDFDVALLKADVPANRCLPLSVDVVKTGTTLYAIGSPGGEEFAFSVSSGIVSGVRQIEGKWFVQTDASLNPGNSGGPLLDDAGHVVAMVSWKVALQGFEGMSFGVPIETVLEKLSISPGNATDVEAPSSVEAAADVTYPIVDVPDLSRNEMHKREIEQRNAKLAQRQEEQRKLDAEYAKKMEKWEVDVKPTKDKRRPFIILGTSLGVLGAGGLVAGGVMSVMIADADKNVDAYHAEWLSSTDPEDIDYWGDWYDKESKRRDVLNVARITSLAIGGAAIVGSVVMAVVSPKLPAKPKRSEQLAPISFSPLIGPAALGMTGTF